MATIGLFAHGQFNLTITTVISQQQKMVVLQRGAVLDSNKTDLPPNSKRRTFGPTMNLRGYYGWFVTLSCTCAWIFLISHWFSWFYALSNNLGTKCDTLVSCILDYDKSVLDLFKQWIWSGVQYFNFFPVWYGFYANKELKIYLFRDIYVLSPL